MTIEHKVTSLIESVLLKLEFELVLVKKIGADLIQIMIDKQGGVTIDDCSQMTRLIRDVLAVDGIMENYGLEVSSPGLDRPLIKPEHFMRFIGHDIKVKTHMLVDRQKKFHGKLLSFDDENKEISLFFDDKTVKIGLDQIQAANLEYKPKGIRNSND